MYYRTCRRTKDTDGNIETKTEKCLAHSLHHDSLLKKVTQGRIKGRKKPVRSREMLLDWLMEKEYKMEFSQLKSMTEDRTERRR